MTITLSGLLGQVKRQSEITLKHTSYGYGSYENVPFQIVTHLFNGPKEHTQLKQLAYAGASSGQRDPYHPDFAKQYTSYISNLTKVLNAMGWDIVNYKAPDGSIHHRLEVTK